MIHQRFSVHVVIFSLWLLLLVACACPNRVPTLYHVKQQIIEYHDSGHYERDIAVVTREAREHLAGQLKSARENMAVVFDVDETCLSNWENERRMDFGYCTSELKEWKRSAQAPALGPTLELYRFADRNKFAIFFITGRREPARAYTKENLIKAGFTRWTGLYLKPAGTWFRSAADFKSQARKEITENGYTIVANIGDQESDLAGGYASRTFKLPNPFYYIP